MIFVQIADSLYEGDTPPVDENLLERAAQETLITIGEHPEADISVVLTNDDQLQELNRNYLGIDAPTDVLSFPAEETDPDSETLYLGDVILSYERARAQAAAGGHSVEDELQLLVVHGTLHLHGYDHATPVEKAEMWEAQAAILNRLGCSISGPVE